MVTDTPENRDSDGRFLPGKSGNPGGRPKKLMEVVELARQHTPAAIQTLGQIMQDEDAPPAARVSASQTLLDRGWGKATVPLELSGGFTVSNAVDRPARETREEWNERRKREIAGAMGAAAGATD